jgi:hypothetical protein
MLHRGRNLRDDARAWRLRLPAQPELTYRGQAFSALPSLGLTVSRLDTSAQQIDLRADPASFDSTTAALSALEFRLTPATWGGFATYDLVGTRVEGNSAIDGAFTLSAFAPYGSLSHRSSSATCGRTPCRAIAAHATYRRDWAESLTSLEAGDVSRPVPSDRHCAMAASTPGPTLRPGSFSGRCRNFRRGEPAVDRRGLRAGPVGSVTRCQRSVR